MYNLMLTKYILSDFDKGKVGVFHFCLHLGGSSSEVQPQRPVATNAVQCFPYIDIYPKYRSVIRNPVCFHYCSSK